MAIHWQSTRPFAESGSQNRAAIPIGALKEGEGKVLAIARDHLFTIVGLTNVTFRKISRQRRRTSSNQRQRTRRQSKCMRDGERGRSRRDMNAATGMLQKCR